MINSTSYSYDNKTLTVNFDSGEYLVITVNYDSNLLDESSTDEEINRISTKEYKVLDYMFAELKKMLPGLDATRTLAG
jgi:hypothetical protein